MYLRAALRMSVTWLGCGTGQAWQGVTVAWGVTGRATGTRGVTGRATVTWGVTWCGHTRSQPSKNVEKQRFPKPCDRERAHPVTPIHAQSHAKSRHTRRVTRRTPSHTPGHTPHAESQPHNPGHATYPRPHAESHAKSRHPARSRPHPAPQPCNSTATYIRPPERAAHSRAPAWALARVHDKARSMMTQSRERDAECDRACGCDAGCDTGWAHPVTALQKR